MNRTEGDVCFTLVHPMYVDDCWIDAGRYLNKAAKTSHGRYDILDIRRDIHFGNQQLWILFDGDDNMIAAITTMFSFYPQKKALVIAFCGSNDDTGWVKHRNLVIGTLNDFARENECNSLELSGRAGWEKVLKSLGFEKSFTTLEMEVT